MSRAYAGRTVLAPLDLTVHRAQVTVLLGTSGSGKSTLLKLMMGLLAPSSGTVRFLGATYPEGQSTAQQRRRMGYVRQGGGLFPHLSARDNVTLLAREAKWPAERTRQRVEELTQLMQLQPDLLERAPDELSGGQRQRVALMRALLLDPEVLLLDESLGALDPITRYDLQRELKRLFGRLKKTVVFVTHDLAEAAYLGDHFLLLREGACVQQGPFAQLRDAPADPFVTRFFEAHRLVPERSP